MVINIKNIIKRSCFEGKNEIGEKNEIRNSVIGFGTYFGANNKIDALKIGKYCSVASNLEIVCGFHPLKKNVSTHPSFYSTNHKNKNKIQLCYVKKTKFTEMRIVEKNWNVVIGNDVWIGSNVKILQGIKICDGAVIAAGALITKDVEPYAIVGGVPAKLIRKRFSDEDIKFLLDLKWWDKGEEWVIENAEFFEDINLLKEKLKNNID